MITRDELYQMVWSESVLSLSRKLGVSHMYIRKVCLALEIPRPGNGYWAKRAVGRAPPIPDLPPLRPGSPDRWSRDRIDLIQIRPFYTNYAVGAVADDTAEHPLVAAARRLLEAAAAKSEADSEVDRVERTGEGSSDEVVEGSAFDAGDAEDAATVAAAFLAPPKRFSLIDVTTSRSALSASLDLADKLYRAFEDNGHRVVIAGTFEPFALKLVDRDTVIFGHPPDDREIARRGRAGPARRRPTVAYIGSTAFGLAVVEISKPTRLHYAGLGQYLSEKRWKKRRRAGRTWVEERWVPCGLLRIVAYSPFFSVPWRQEWSETRSGQLATRVGTIVADLEAVASRVGDWGVAR